MAKWISKGEVTSPYSGMDATNKKMPTPSLLTRNGINLVLSQQTSLYAMIQLERRGGWRNGRTKVSTRMGTYTDRVGAGKTLTAISLLQLLKPHRCREFEG